MIEKLKKSSGNVLGFKVSGTVEKDDYNVLLPEVEAVINEHGSVNLLLDMNYFKWEAVDAWGADMKFGQDYRKKIEKMAFVGDKRWQKWLAKVADPFFAGEAKYFETAESESAWTWLRQ